MININDRYDNQLLLDALKDRDDVYNNIFEANPEYSDEDLARLNRVKHLSQFQRDLLYLTSKMSVYDIAKLYNVSARYLYFRLAEIKKILSEKS